MLEDIHEDPTIGSTESSMSEHRKQLRKNVASGTNLNYVQAAYGFSLDLPGLSAEMAQFLVQMPSILATAASATGLADADSGEELSPKPEATSGFEVSSVDDGAPQYDPFEVQPDGTQAGFGPSEYYADTTPDEMSAPAPAEPAPNISQPQANAPSQPTAVAPQEQQAQTPAESARSKLVAAKAEKRAKAKQVAANKSQAADGQQEKPQTRESLLRNAGIDNAAANAMLREAASASQTPVKSSQSIRGGGNLYPGMGPQDVSITDSNFADAVARFSAATASEMESATQVILENASRIAACERLLNEAAT